MRFHDGAYGTLLATHLHGDETVDDLCVRAPQLVVDAHRAYIDAGASAIQTNSFLAHLRGSDRRRALLRRAAVDAARDAAGDGPDAPLVLATIGPIGDRPHDFWELIEQLLELGVRGVQCETVSTRAIADAFLDAWVEVAAGVDDVELLLGCSCDPTDAATSRWVVELAGDAPDGVQLGLNCCTGPSGLRGLLEVICELRGSTWVMPSAGIPTGTPPIWPWANPRAWAQELAEQIDELPVTAVGGCCGTAPAMIELLEVSD